MNPWGSPMELFDKEWLERFKWTPERFADYASRAREVLDRLEGVDTEALEPVAAGECDDCRLSFLLRWRFGKFDLCRPCIGHRVAAGTRSAEAWTEWSTA